MKLESLVTVNQNVTVNMFLGLVLTARQVMGVGGARSYLSQPSGADNQGETNNWD